MEINQEITYKKEDNADKAFVCQYIVNAGSNNDSIERNGTAHFIEHFLIHISGKNKFFKKGMIHGFTGFYYTNYYWYVNDATEAIRSFAEFEKILCNGVIDLDDEKLFADTKKEIEKEIIFFAEKMDRLSKIVSTLSDDKNEVFLPIGSVKDVRKIEYQDIIDFLHNNYVPSKVHKCFFDSSNKISYLSELGVRQMQIPATIEKKQISTLRKSCDKFKRMNTNILLFDRSMDVNSVKIICRDVFVSTLEEIIIGEIFMMQTCDYLKKKMDDDTKIGYEKMFISNNRIYFVITIQNISPTDYVKVIGKQKLEMYNILQDILEKNGFKRISSFILNYLLEHERMKVEEKEIMMDLINYVTLSYGSYNIVDNKICLADFINDLGYKEYCDYIYEKIMSNSEESIRLLS